MCNPLGISWRTVKAVLSSRKWCFLSTVLRNKCCPCYPRWSGHKQCVSRPEIKNAWCTLQKEYEHLAVLCCLASGTLYMHIRNSAYRCWAALTHFGTLSGTEISKKTNSLFTSAQLSQLSSLSIPNQFFVLSFPLISDVFRLKHKARKKSSQAMPHELRGIPSRTHRRSPGKYRFHISPNWVERTFPRSAHSFWFFFCSYSMTVNCKMRFCFTIHSSGIGSRILQLNN